MSEKNIVSVPQRGLFIYPANHQNLVTWKIHVDMGTKLYNVISSEQFSMRTVSHIHCFCAWSTTHTAYFEDVLSFFALHQKYEMGVICSEHNALI